MKTRSGLEILLDGDLTVLRGRSVGAVVHPASLDSRFRHLVDLFHEHPEIRLTCLMGPQHGARGETQDNMIEWEDYRDPATGIPVYSLYGATRKPTPEMLQQIDVLVFDLQDVGARYYTFVHTMALCMQACSEAGKTIVILDRPNPINGVDVEGPVLDPKFSSFVGLYPLPLRHGMTVGEMARYFNQEMGIGCALEIIPMEGWKRDCFWDETGLPWIPPSPNLPTLDSAIVYPGGCLFEGTNVSEGRGTTRPFEFTGAPWIDAQDLSAEMNQAGLPGTFFRPAWFVPTFHKWTDRMVGGLQIHVLDRAGFRPIRTALHLLQAYRRRGGSQFAWTPPPYEYEEEKLPFDILCGTDQVREGLEAGLSVEELETQWRPGLEDFLEVRRRYLLY